MKKILFSKEIALVLVVLLAATLSWAQGDKSKRPSPPATAKGKAAGANVSIDYSSPSVKGRKIWGELVPYNKFWRAGANEATIFKTDKAVKIGDKTVPAGSYSLFMKPGEKEWTVVLNSQTGQWGIKQGGDANFDPAKNVAEVTVTPGKAPKMTERLMYEVTGTGFDLVWENMKVSVPVK